MVYRYLSNDDGNGAEGPLQRVVASVRKGFLEIEQNLVNMFIEDIFICYQYVGVEKPVIWSWTRFIKYLKYLLVLRINS